jgi:hypothetical protein
MLYHSGKFDQLLLKWIYTPIDAYQQFTPNDELDLTLAPEEQHPLALREGNLNTQIFFKIICSKSGFYDSILRLYFTTLIVRKQKP